MKNLYTKFGNVAKDQDVVRNNDGTITFISYDTEIATYDHLTEELKLNGEWWDYSNTTRYYFKQFINNFTCYEYKTKKQFIKEVL